MVGTGALLVVSDVTRRFGPVTVLSGVDFTVAAGQAVAIVGPNGSGKTTLLRIVVGADRPDQGRVLLAGAPVRESNAGVRAAVASVLDDAEFFPDLSVREHLSLLAYAHGAPDVRAVDGVIEDLGLSEVRSQLPPTLSSGQLRRAALASCFVRPRRLLVLDEPEQRLDVAGRDWLIERLRREKSDGVAIVFASHDPAIVAAVSDEQIAVDR